MVDIESEDESSASSFDNWVQSMAYKLASLDNDTVEACSISLVPEQLRKLKGEAYMPQVVSIGPLHKGTRTNLVYMEEIKLRCMRHLFLRTREEDKANLTKCFTVLSALDAIVRASYADDDLKFNLYDLAKIMVLDGCFLLELLISGSSQLSHLLLKKEMVEKTPKNTNPDDKPAEENPVNSTSPGAKVIQREKVLSDLMMLENQIPLFVLLTLFKVLFPERFAKDEITMLIQKHALSIMGYSTRGCSHDSFSKFEAFNFLELVHSFIDKEKNETKTEVKANTAKNENMKRENEVNKDFEISIGNGQDVNRKVKLQHCATRLKAAGVQIESPQATNMTETRFNLKITFSNGKLIIPQLHITETTEAKWRNLIAWEVNRTNLEKLRGGITNKKKGRSSCQFISYARFFQSLTCCVHDVKLLRDKNVIKVHKVESEDSKEKIMNNEDLLNLFRAITKGVPDAEINTDSMFRKVIKDLNSYPTSEDRSRATCGIMVYGANRYRKIIWHIFRCFLTWNWYNCREAYAVLRRVYIPSGWTLIGVLAAAAGLALTIAQTVFSAQDR